MSHTLISQALFERLGVASINLGTSGAEAGAGFGDEKETGGRGEAGSNAWKACMQRQISTINREHSLPSGQGISFNLS